MIPRNFRCSRCTRRFTSAKAVVVHQDLSHNGEGYSAVVTDGLIAAREEMEFAEKHGERACLPTVLRLAKALTELWQIVGTSSELLTERHKPESATKASK